MKSARWIGAVGLIAVTLALSAFGGDSLLRSLWPALVAIGVIVLAKEAVLGLACGVVAAAWLLAGGDAIKALRLAFAEHLFPAMQGPWRVGALVFTLVLGSFAGILERSGGFETLLRKILSDGRDGGRRLLGGTYAIGLLCFFDGLASSLLTGRIARPLVDRADVSRERLAWVVDSTGSPIACVAFISTWIATQLSLIEQGLKDAPFVVEPYAMFFLSVPANAYCLLTLLLVPLAIFLGYQPRAMRRFKSLPPEEIEAMALDSPRPWVVLVPLSVLVIAIIGGFPLLASERINVFSIEGWKTAFSSDSGPYALVFGSVVGWITALLCFPVKHRHHAAHTAIQGAGSLLPALVVLIFAWTLGSMFVALGTTERIAELLADSAPVAWLPLVIFLVGSSMAFTTGSSWGTMGLLMPLALPATVAAAVAAGMPAAEIQGLAAMVIGAVFGGATLGDHCSPFSDTTIVSALASGCRTMDHVTSQLPFAAMAAVFASAAYALMALGLTSILATLTAAVVLVIWVIWRSRAC